MDILEYQQGVARTLLDEAGFDLTPQEIMLVWDGLGLAGEAGEVVDHLKKAIFHRHGLDLEKLEDELGDVLWYITAICLTAKLDLGEIMRKNIEKLKVRYPDGYTSKDSLSRVDQEK